MITERYNRMKLEKAENRDNQYHKKKNGMRITNKSIFVILEIQVKKSKDIKKNRKG